MAVLAQAVERERTANGEIRRAVESIELLRRPLADILSQPGRRTICAQCEEEVMNEREVVDENGRILCQTCAGNSYYLAS